jgi:hypothetical protein
VKLHNDKYDKRFSKLIRTRDQVCQRCLRPGRTECSHIYSRRHAGLRHDTRNAKALCHICHRWWHSNPADAHDWLLSIIGQKNYDLLKLQANTATKKPSKIELDIIYDEMKAEIDYLESIPEPSRVHLQWRNRHG